MQRQQSGQQTVCPPNVDSSPGNILLNQCKNEPTSGHQTIFAIIGCCEREHVWSTEPQGSTTWRASEQWPILIHQMYVKMSTKQWARGDLTVTSS